MRLYKTAPDALRFIRLADQKPTSLTQYVTALPTGAFVTFAAFLGRTPVLALGDGTLLLAEIGEPRTLVAHANGAILTAACNGKLIITGGDDGRVMQADAGGDITEIAVEKGRWIDALALRADGAMAWAAGKMVRARDTKGEIKTLEAASGVRGLDFATKGYRLALSHYNGLSLWFPNAAAAPEELVWKGAHLDVTLSPDGRFAVSSMQETSLHGWRLADKKDMRMSGYPGKTRSMSWSGDGHWLATSGAEACIVWPFQSRDGPMGKPPQECGVREARVSRVAFHPKTLVVALGYEDGWVMLCRLTDAAELLVRARREGESKGAISALAWSADGNRLVFGTVDGEAGVLDLPK